MTTLPEPDTEVPKRSPAAPSGAMSFAVSWSTSSIPADDATDKDRVVASANNPKDKRSFIVPTEGPLLVGQASIRSTAANKTTRRYRAESRPELIAAAKRLLRAGASAATADAMRREQESSAALRR